MIGELRVLRRDPGPEALATVVLVHGAMDRGASFGRVTRRLDGFDVVAYDRRGYDGSLAANIDTPHVLDQHCDDLVAISTWARHDPGTPLVVIGHSLGGLIALLASGSAPPEVFDRVGAFEAPLPWLHDSGETAGESTLAVGRSEGPAAAAEHFYRSMVGERAWQRLPERTRELRRAEGDALMAELAAARRPPGGSSEVPKPGPSVALSVARGDKGPPHLLAAAQLLADSAGVPCETLAGATHGAHLSHPGLFAAWVRRVATDTSSTSEQR